MSQNQTPDQYSRSAPVSPAFPAMPATATPSALGVKPDARLAAAFLSQAFLWMFAGLLVTGGVAAVVQSNDRLLAFAAGSFFPLIIAQLAIVVVISAAINRISALAALALFFVYAASLGVTIGLIVSVYTEG